MQALLDEKADWHRQWQLIVQDPWFHRQLGKIARSTIRRLHLPRDSEADIRQSVILNLALSMQRHRGFGFQASRGDLERYLLVMVRRNCQRAARQFREIPSLGSEQHLSQQRWRNQELTTWLQQSVREMPKPASDCVRLYLNGWTVTELARESGCSRRSVYRILGQAKKKLTRELQIPESITDQIQKLPGTKRPEFVIDK